MGKLFGTDGVRGVAGKDLTCELALQIGRGTAAVLTSLGGIVGVITGIALAELISGMMQIPVSISVPAIIIAVVFSTLIGVAFGLLPATQAANLNPIEALRRD